MFAKRVKSHHLGHPKRAEFSSESELFEFLSSNTPSQKEGGIYIHVPFCDNICSFCSMNRTKLEKELDEYCEYLLEQIQMYSKFPYIAQKSFESVYFGGGTPTIFKERHLEQILSAIREKFNLSPTCEFSMESTLHNLSLSKLNLLKNFGVNRLSIGIQTFDEDSRKLLNRVHDSKKALHHLSDLRASFDGLLCADIIYNYPNQSEAQVRRDAKILKDIGIDSTSFYSLIYFEGSEFAKTHTDEYYELKTDKMLHHAFVDEMLNGDEYEFLELTKISKKGRDNYKYIRLTHAGVDILPIGLKAGGGLGNFGIFNMKKTMKMVGILPENELRYRKFISLFQYPSVKFADMLKFISKDGLDELTKTLKIWEQNGLLNIDESGIMLSLDGIFWGNTISEEIIKITNKEFE